MTLDDKDSLVYSVPISSMSEFLSPKYITTGTVESSPISREDLEEEIAKLRYQNQKMWGKIDELESIIMILKGQLEQYKSDETLISDKIKEQIKKELKDDLFKEELKKKCLKK